MMSPMRATVRKHAVTPVTEAAQFYGQSAGLYCRCQDLACLCKGTCTEKPGPTGFCEWCEYRYSADFTATTEEE